jgi:hypothetical protein
VEFKNAGKIVELEKEHKKDFNEISGNFFG